MNFDDLEYISLEGGGGKGAVYLGAIKALESLFEKKAKSGEILKIKDGKLIPPLVSDIPDPGNVLKSKKDSSSILDYYHKDCSDCIVKGISGSSAGAITAFPLALGLTSDDIESILKGYEFEKEFMSNDLHEGKYRMVGMDNNGNPKILVAEDKFKKLGENKIKPFDFDFVAAELRGTNKKPIGKNSIKSMIRNQIVSFGFKIILSGLSHLYEPVDSWIKKIKKQLKITSLITENEFENDTDGIEIGPLNLTFFKIWEFAFTKVMKLYAKVMGAPSYVKVSNSLPNVVLNLLKGIFFPKKLLGFVPRDNITGAVSNLIWDRGIYAGFEVREFFFRIVLLALSKDTHFRRKLIENHEILKEFGITEDDINKIEGSVVDFKIKKKANNEGILIKMAGRLAENLTFEKFYQITNINLSCCVSNATYGQPMYFSAYFTPNFPVIEAMGSSMSFPMAFKPLYNEANVLKGNRFNEEFSIQNKKFVTKKITKYTVYYKESFSQNDFYKYQNVVLNYIKHKCSLNFSVNSNLSFRSYLPYLRAVIHNNDFEVFNYNSIEYSKEEIENLCCFFYNSVFKGLFVDGGATNNLPVAVHTYINPKSDILKYDNIQNLEFKNKVLSLKLDNSFPQELLDKIENQLLPITRKYNTKLEDIVNKYNEIETNNFLENTVTGAYKTLPNYREFTPIANIIDLRIKEIMKQEFDKDISKPVLKKIIAELKKRHKDDEKGFTPWNKQIFFVNAVMNPLQFGMDQGQIENINDNENIIPLYCYGLDVFDFDLTSDDSKPLVKIANEGSEESVLKYFKNVK